MEWKSRTFPGPRASTRTSQSARWLLRGSSGDKNWARNSELHRATRSGWYPVRNSRASKHLYYSVSGGLVFRAMPRQTEQSRSCALSDRPLHRYRTEHLAQRKFVERQGEGLFFEGIEMSEPTGKSFPRIKGISRARIIIMNRSLRVPGSFALGVAKNSIVWGRSANGRVY